MAEVSNCRAESVGQLQRVSRLTFHSVCFKGIVLQSDGRTAKQLVVVEVQGWEIGGGEGGPTSRS